MLRVKMRGRETVFHLSVSKRDAKKAALEHTNRFKFESVPSGRKDHRGRDIYERREVPLDIWVFEWFDTDDPGPDDVGEPITIP